MPRWALRGMAAGLVCVVAVACSGRHSTEPGDVRVPLLVRADLSATTATTVVVVVTAADIPIPLVFNIPVTDGVASGVVTLLAGSNRTITMHAYDEAGIETHRGVVTVTIRPGSNPPIQLTLAPLAGDLPIDVTLGALAVTLAPATNTMPPAGTATLTATIVDAFGAPVLQPVTWATLNPGIATVVSTGDRTALVTGVAPGSTSVVANFGGSAGAATIVVSATPVFPGAEGYGATTAAGRGGQVIRVTNLDDAGPGSLRAALEASGPRTVIFDVSGQIDLSDAIVIGGFGVTDRDFLTVAGQTAPSPGITVNGTIVVRNRDVLIQHLRIRPGADEPNTDALAVVDPSQRIVLDHMSLEWATDGNLDIDMDVSDLTLRESIVAWPFPAVGGKNSLIFGRNVAILRSLFAHAYDRNPEATGGSRILWGNVLVYDHGEAGRQFGIWGNAHHIGPYKVSFIGSVCKKGSSDGKCSPLLHHTTAIGSEFYAADNDFADGFDIQTANVIGVGAPPFPLPNPFTPLPQSTLQSDLVANAGARPFDRDPVDALVIADLVNGTGSQISNESAVGGYPSLAQNTRALALPTNPNGDDDGDGYTNLEELLHALAACVEGHSSNLTQCRAWAVIP